MRVVTTRQEATAASAAFSQRQLSLGFVPTMGALHEGHIALVRQSVQENDRTAVSIFVNPIQFNNPQDLQKYPRTLEHDLALLEPVMGEEDYVFTPSVEEMYPDQAVKSYDFGQLEQVMEGRHRPGHFNGVGVVVDRLFRITDPDRSYFGEKDFQQLAIIRKLKVMEQHRTEIISCATVREADGLAMSSRNTRLEPALRRLAPEVHRLLQEARTRIRSGSRNLDELAGSIEEKLNALPGFRTEYVTFARENDLQPADPRTNQPFRCFIAVFAGDVRLIDNLPMY